MSPLLKFILLIYLIRDSRGTDVSDVDNKKDNHVLGDISTVFNRTDVQISSFVYWPNATVPFYVVPEHFDKEQTTAILTALAQFSFKTCLKFAPVLAAPSEDHVLVFENPGGVRKCVVGTEGHPVDEPHVVTLGYDCLKSPQIDMMLMKSLGFPFEHNRAIRDLFIDVQFENIDPSAFELFEKDDKLPQELRSLAYDVDSVMHFGERDYSKNGHRTIVFKEFSHNPVKQSRRSLSDLDLRKVELVYGPECRKRDRQEKIELCQNYPGVARRKREVEEQINLRVNRDITPSPTDLSVHLNDSLKELGIEEEVQEIVDHVYKVSSRALRNARAKYCNGSKADLRVSEEREPRNYSREDILGIIEAVTDYAKNIVDNAVANLTVFCEASENIESFQHLRRGCPFYNGHPCPQTYRSTKFGPVRHSTQHRPTYYPSTKNRDFAHKGPFMPIGHRSGDAKENEGNKTDVVRRKRSVDTTEPLPSSTASSISDNGESGKADVTTEGNAHGGRRDDVTRIIYHRSKDDELAANADNKPRRKSLVEAGNSTDVTKDDTNSPNTTKDIEHPEVPEGRRDNSSKGDLRAGTAIPVPGNRNKYVNPLESHRRLNKYSHKSNGRSKKSEDFALTLELTKKSSESASEREDKDDDKKETQDEEEVKTTADKEPERDLEKEEYSMKKQKLSRLPSTQKSEDSKPVEDVVEALTDLVEDDQNYEPLTVALSKANKEFYDERKWEGGVVPYVLKEDPNYDMDDIRMRLDEVNRILNKKTCVRLHELTEREAARVEDYLVVDTSADYVTGRVGGKQNFGSLELFRGGQHRQHAAMVVMAMLGFYFELARHDRDRHVRVHLRHVRPDKLHHFEKIRADATFDLKYDYESATHPAWQFWRKIGKTGISTVATFKSKDPNGTVMKSLGQHSRLLSELDLVKINSVYGTKCFSRGRLRVRPEKKTHLRIRGARTF